MALVVVRGLGRHRDSKQYSEVQTPLLENMTSQADRSVLSGPPGFYLAVLSRHIVSELEFGDLCLSGKLASP